MMVYETVVTAGYRRAYPGDGAAPPDELILASLRREGVTADQITSVTVERYDRPSEPPAPGIVFNTYIAEVVEDLTDWFKKELA